MSPILIAAGALNNIGKPETKVVDYVEPKVPPMGPEETPIAYRDRLREAIRARGADPLEIETIPGNCNQQVATQTDDYTAWLAAN